MEKIKSKTIFVCTNCGTQRLKWEGRCGECKAWNTIIEESFNDKNIYDNSSTNAWLKDFTSEKIEVKNLSIKNLDSDALLRYTTKINELDRIFGGGLVKGSLTLLGGAPGIGKSTLLMQFAQGIAKNVTKILYVSAEESTDQIILRARRLNINSENVSIISTNNLDKIISFIRQEKPPIIIIDSIQTVYLSELSSPPGSVSQVKECTGRLMTITKNLNLSLLIIGHINKEGSLAGPKILEHMVDTVLIFEGEMNNQFRILRCTKNRFGATNEIGVFEMTNLGLKEVANPSEIFFNDREDKVIGSAIFASMEGTRSILCEIQSLLTPTPMAMPRRISLGIDLNRLHLICAVLIKHLNLKLYQNDIYINVVGGLKISDPAIDLAMAASMISNEKNIPLSKEICFLGEIGLSGEIRAISHIEERIKESIKLGFKNFILPWANKKQTLNYVSKKSLNLTYLKKIKQLLEVFS